MRSKILPDYCISGRKLDALDGAVIHYFSAKNVDADKAFDLDACRNLFKDLNRAKANRELYMLEDNWPIGRMYASAHILIGRAGEVWKLCEYDRQAYHAGASILNGRESCNRWTLGIELVGHNASGFSEDQYRALAKLLAGLITGGMDRANILGHDSVRWAAIEAGSNKKKKYDPSGRYDGQGDNFDWSFLQILIDEELEDGEASPV